MSELKEIEVSFTTVVPVDATNEEICEWLEYELGARGSMNPNNPCDGDIDGSSVSFG